MEVAILAKQRLYYIFKLTTSRLEENKFNIQLDINQARLNGELISVSDNQMFYMIRKYRKQETDFGMLRNLYKKRDYIKCLDNSKDNINKISNLQERIDDILFVNDIVNIKVDNKKTYKQIAENGFSVNGIEYVRIACGAGQARRNTVSFINKEIAPTIYDWLMNGLSISKINLNKFNAYFGLYMSGINIVSTPRVCLINDYETILPEQKVDYIVDKQDDTGKIYRDIEERIIDFKTNKFDGQGLISPKMAKIWANDLSEYKYMPAQFIIRSSFIKGMVTVFDFHRFSEEIAGTDEIIDVYGNKYKIKDIDILLTVSQFKMWKYYKSWEEYVFNCEKYGHIWGISRYTSKKDAEYSLLNYQYIQTLDLNIEKIRELAQPTIDWIDKICSGNKLYTLLFLLGVSKDKDSLDDILNKTGNDIVKAIIYNDELLKDPYVRKKIYSFIERRIKDAKLGRLWVRGNYQIMVADPYEQCEFAFGLEPKGLLQAGEYYSKFWNDRKITKVDACRSPMVDFHEHNILNLVRGAEIAKWYQYLDTGIVYNTYGLDTVIHSDSDWDGDIVFTTDNKIVLGGVIPGLNPITYDKVSAPPMRMRYGNLIKADIRSFDCKVGQVTNYSTSFIAMLANFKKGSPEHNELLKRIKLLRRYIGDSIDSAKGIKMLPFPKEWKTGVKYLETDGKDIISEKRFRNVLVSRKKPYFMMYIYEKLINEYGSYRKDYRMRCRENFNISIQDLLSSKYKDLNEDQTKFRNNYYRNNPVLKSNCVMNELCWMIESIDIKKKFPKDTNQFDYTILMDESVPIDNKKLEVIEKIYKEYKVYKSRIKLQSVFDDGDSDYIEINENMIDKFIKDAYDISSNDIDIANMCVYVNYILYPNSPKDFAWNVGREGLLKNIIKNQKPIKYVPVKDEYGVEYLGERYFFRRV